MGAEGAVEVQEATRPRSLSGLAPVFDPRGAPSSIPETLTVSFAEPLAPEGSTEGTEIAIEPGGGFVSWANPRTLVISPTEGLPPATPIRVRISALATRHGVITGPPLEHHFRTPPFTLVEAVQMGAREHEAEVELRFSGPVSPEAVQAALKVELGGRPVETLRVQGTALNRAVRLVVKDRLVGTTQQLRVRLKRPVPMLGHPEIKAPARSVQVALTGHQKSARVMNVALVEGSEGWLLHVVCTDDGSGPPRQYFWSPELSTSYRLSNRCVLEEDDLDHISLEPSVPVRVSGTRGGFRVLGKLPRGPVKLRIRAGARTVDGGTFLQTYEKTLEVRPRTPQLSFTTSGRYVPRDRIHALPYRALNVRKMSVLVQRVPPQNLAFWVGRSDESTDALAADPVARTELELPGEIDQPYLSTLDLRKLLKNPKSGLYVVSLSEIPPEGAEYSSPSATLKVVITDLDIIAKRGPDFVDAWTLNTHDLSAQRGVELSLLQPSGTVRGRCTTDGDGHCRIRFEDGKRSGVSPPSPFGLLAQRGDETSYLAFEEVRTPTGEADVSGASTGAGSSPFVAALWMDRGIFRPGETANLSSVVWTRDANSAPKAGLPVELRLLDPRGMEISRKVIETSPTGLLTYSHAFPATARTGRHRFELRIGDHYIGSEAFLVEAFVPERMRVDAEGPASDVLDTEDMKVEVAAQWLFGGSAADSQVAMNCTLRPIALKMAGFESFHFGPHPHELPPARELGTVSGTLDENGQTTLACPPLDARSRGIGPARIQAEVAVFEGEGGRATRATATGRRLPSEVLIGLRSNVQVAESGKPIPLEGVLLGPDGRALGRSGSLQAELLQVERETDWIYDDERGHWTYEVHERLSGDQKVELQVEQGKFQLSFTPATAASAYLVRVQGMGASSELRVEGDPWGYHRWYSSEGGDRTPKPGAPESVPLDLPASIAQGEKAKVSATIPFAGRALYTVESNQLLHQEWFDVRPGKLELDLRVEALVPNVYVSLLVLENPHADSPESFVPSRGWGLGSVRIVPTPLTLPTRLTAPETLRSSAPLTVELEVEGDAELVQAVVAVVDEGILSLTRFATPNPIVELFEKRALEVETFDTVGWNLLLPASGPSGRTGGGAGSEPPAAMPVEPIALWSGPVKVENGKASVRFDIPEYRGKLRVMAVAASPRRVGHAETWVVVRDPVVVEPTLPRVLTEGDEVQIPILVSNLSGKAQDLELTLQARALGLEEGGVDASVAPDELIQLSRTRHRLQLADGAKQTVWVNLKAKGAAGVVELRTTATSAEVTTSAAARFQLRPDRPEERAVNIVRVESRRIVLKDVLGAWVPGTETTQLVLTRNPYARNAGHLEYLIRYPHGCIEQTSSKVRALLYLDRFLPGSKRLEERPELLRRGLERIISMQTPSGGFAYWPGQSEPVSWGSAYALDLLLDAQAEGIPVPEAVLKRALTWAEEVVERSPTDDAVPYLHYVLAKAKRARHGEIDAALSRLEQGRHQNGRAAEQRALLWAAKYLGGDRRVAPKLKSLSERAPAAWTRSNDWSFYSERRRWALQTALLVEQFGPEPWLNGSLQDLGAALDASSSHYTTQELAWTLTALGRALPPTEAALPKATLTDGGKPLGANEAKASTTWQLSRASERELVLEVEEAGGPKPYLLVVAQGVRPDGTWELGGADLEVERKLMTEEGSVVSGPVPLGTRLYSVSTISNPNRRTVRNLALVDVFAAGLEPELPRSDHRPSWIGEDDAWATAYVDIRDDRAKAFGDLGPRARKTFWVAVRAVSAGRQAHPPVHAEAMYDPTLWARSAAPALEVAKSR